MATENEKRPTLSHGKICYVEIPAVDIAASSTFYERVFGWALRNRSDGSVAFDDGVGEVSGTWVLGCPAMTHPGLLMHIMVDSVADALEAVTANGGAIVEPIGRHAPEITARFSDPAGNVFGLYQEPSA